MKMDHKIVTKIHKKKEDKDSLNIIKRGKWTKEDVSQAITEKGNEAVNEMINPSDDEKMETTATTPPSKGKNVDK